MTKASDEAMRHLCESLAPEIGAGKDFELELGELVGKYRRRHKRDVDRQMQEADCARLLHEGPANLAERQGCHRVTVYRRAARAKKRSCTPAMFNATSPA
jgi:hypothetical protein